MVIAHISQTFHFFFSTPHIADVGDSGLLKDDVVRELKSELQRCLSHLKSKRLKISELQEELKSSQTKTECLQTQLDQETARDSKVKTYKSNSLFVLLG